MSFLGTIQDVFRIKFGEEFVKIIEQMASDVKFYEDFEIEKKFCQTLICHKCLKNRIIRIT